MSEKGTPINTSEILSQTAEKMILNQNEKILIDFSENEKIEQYCHKPFPRKDEANYISGDRVYVLQGLKIFAKGIIIDLIQEGQFKGKFKVEFKDKTTYHVKPNRLIRIEDPGTILVVRETNDYRRIAKTQVCPSDYVMEIGSDFGYTTNFISQTTKNVIGIDKSQQQIIFSKKEYPHIEFILMDVLEEQDEFENLHKCNKVFVDINGNRELEAVQKVVELVKRVMKPELIVVKARSYFDHVFGTK